MHRERLPLPSYGELRKDAMNRTLGGVPPAPYTMADASGLRISKQRRTATIYAALNASPAMHPHNSHCRTMCNQSVQSFVMCSSDRVYKTSHDESKRMLQGQGVALFD